MMKRILLSVITITLVSAVAFGATRAYFNDEEKKEGNTFSTGTIDIAVNDQNPWEATNPYVMADMKPSQTDYIDFTVHNVGTNPVNLFKTLNGFAPNDPANTVSEPECLAEGGGWVDTICSNRVAVSNIDTQINYDMKVELYNGDPKGSGILVWWETIYTDTDNVKLSTLKDTPMYLGMIPVGWYLKVKQSYHMVDTGTNNQNQYQSDGLTFNVVLDAEQLGVKALRLENKEEVQFGGYSHTMLGDGKYADLTYKVRDREFSYTLGVHGMGAGQAYTLIQYPDPLDGSDAWSNRANSLALINITVDGSGDGSKSGSINLGKDLKNAKIWLIPGTFTPGSAVGSLFPWNPTNTLFETGLMDYYDADL